MINTFLPVRYCCWLASPFFPFSQKISDSPIYLSQKAPKSDHRTHRERSVRRAKRRSEKRWASVQVATSQNSSCGEIWGVQTCGTQVCFPSWRTHTVGNKKNELKKKSTTERRSYHSGSEKKPAPWFPHCLQRKDREINASLNSCGLRGTCYA